ncbi:MAG: cell envelope integrity protein TolA [Parabacteroides sp.]
MSKWNKDDITGLIGTLAFHALILLLLWSCVLRTRMPEEEGGILVNFGNVDASAGLFEPKYTGQELPVEDTTPPPPETQPEAPKEEMITQNIEESVSIDEEKQKKEEDRKKREEAEKKRKEEAEKERQRQIEAEKKRKAEEQRKKEQAIQNQVAGAFGIGSAEGNNQGDAASGKGNQGSPFGNSDHGANEGIGGMGTFSLANRHIITGKVAEPAYTEKEEGKIVIDIVVDTKGNVIRADIGRGTTIDDASMRLKAIQAAKRNKFNEISGVNNQSGTITYHYKLK